VPDSRILLGVIGRAHGVRGLVRVTSHTADPADITAYGPLTDAKGRRFGLSWRGEGIAEVSEWVNGVPVKVADRTAAERLTNTRLYVDRSTLPAPDDDEFYLADLIGLAAVDVDGAAVGVVSVVHDYGAGVSLEIEAEGRPVLILPFTKACVPEVDVVAGRVVVVRPAETVVTGEASEPAGSPEASLPDSVLAGDGPAATTVLASSPRDVGGGPSPAMTAGGRAAATGTDGPPPARGSRRPSPAMTAAGAGLRSHGSKRSHDSKRGQDGAPHAPIRTEVVQ
jgi:16S rRNA processing protein RimM